jgi:hypothetical protein
MVMEILKWRVAGGRRQAIAQHVRDNDEVFLVNAFFERRRWMLFVPLFFFLGRV